MSSAQEAPRIAFLTRGLQGGGVQQMTRNLACEIAARGYRVDLLIRRAGPVEPLPAGVRVEVLPRRPRSFGRLLALRADPQGLGVLARPVLLPLVASEAVAYLPGLVRYLRKVGPDALIAATTYANLVAIWARRLAGVPTRVIVSERDNLSENLATGRWKRAWRWRHAAPLISHTYPGADAIVAVSDGVAEDLARVTGIPRASIHTVYNPVLTGELAAMSQEKVGEPWLLRGAPPVILAAGRLVAKKDYATLIRAFARVRAVREARLIILGDGPERARLERVARQLEVAEHVRFSGWVSNPFAYMARASVFALSSNREGLPGVLVQALACGCLVVSTDCPSGPAEILEHGRYGALVPVGDDAAMAAALLAALDSPPDRARLEARASMFDLHPCADAYLELLGLPHRVDAGDCAVRAAAGG